MNIELTINSRNAGKKYNISDIGDGEIKWVTNRSGVAGQLTFDLIKHGEIICHEGDQVALRVDNHPYFCGYIFSKSKTQEKISIVCYDMLKYLKSKQSYNFSGHTLSSVVQTIAKDYNLTTGIIEDTKHVLEDKLYEGQSLFDIITDCITLTAVATQKIYILYDGVNQLCLREMDNLKIETPVITPENLAREFTYKTSIEDSYNIVKLVQPNKSTGKGDAYVLQDQEKIDTWGKLQYYEKVSEDLDEAGIRKKVVDLLHYYAQTQRQLTIHCTGVPGVFAGCTVPIKIPALGDIDLSKKLLVEKCTHTWSNKDHTMDLEMKVYNG